MRESHVLLLSYIHVSRCLTLFSNRQPAFSQAVSVMLAAPRRLPPAGLLAAPLRLVERVRRAAEHEVLVVHAVRDGLRGVLADVETVETAVHPVVLRDASRLQGPLRLQLVEGEQRERLARHDVPLGAMRRAVAGVVRASGVSLDLTAVQARRLGANAFRSALSSRRSSTASQRSGSRLQRRSGGEAHATHSLWARDSCARLWRRGVSAADEGTGASGSECCQRWGWSGGGGPYLREDEALRAAHVEPQGGEVGKHASKELPQPQRGGTRRDGPQVVHIRVVRVPGGMCVCPVGCGCAWRDSSLTCRGRVVGVSAVRARQ